MFDEVFNKYCLCNYNDAVKEEDLPNEALKRLWRCEWTPQTLKDILQSWVGDNNRPISNKDESWEMLSEVITMSMLFVQYNYTGPFHQLGEYAIIMAASGLMPCDPFKDLMVNGEEINPNVKLGQLLVIAKAMLHKLLIEWPDSMYLHWWHLRLTCLHQQVIDELASSLYDDLKKDAELLMAHVDTLNDPELEALLHVEVANGYLLFHRGQKSEEVLKRLCERLQVQLRVMGLMGVRTKFQKEPLPQLCLKVEQQAPAEHELPPAAHTNGSTSIPKLLLLDDDTRLERIRFALPEDNAVMTLPSVLQALLLAKVKQLKRSQPKDRLADEELEPYIQTLLYQEFGPLQIRQATLLLNCVQESTQRRTVERSLKQCEEAVKLLDDHTQYSMQERLSYAFAGFMQPKWQVQLQLCDLLISLGMSKTALDIYLEIQAWPEVIMCYTRLELRHKAAEVIRQELEKKPTVLLHCLLGDATDDPECYATAWEFSQHTSGKAQAHWGMYLFQRREYEEAIPHLEKSVEINSLQEKIWLRLGYAAIALERWQLAVHAYITYTHLEPLGFESWNNLSKALIQLGDKKRAHKVLGEALKCNFSNWKVWENFMVVSLDTSHFEDTMNAYLRLTELKDRYLDLEVLSITMHALANGKPDAKGQTPERLFKKAVHLMGHQCVKHPNEPTVWELAALVAPTSLNASYKLMKAGRAYMAKDPGWASKPESVGKVLQLTRDMCRKSLRALRDAADNPFYGTEHTQLQTARLTALGCVRAVERNGQPWMQAAPLLVELKVLLQRMLTSPAETTEEFL